MADFSKNGENFLKLHDTKCELKFSTKPEMTHKKLIIPTNYNTCEITQGTLPVISEVTKAKYAKYQIWSLT